MFDWLYFPIDWNTNNFGNQFAPGLYSCVMIWLIIAIVCYIVLSRTQAGNWIYSTGGNLSAAKANGVPTDKVKVSLFMFSAFCATVFATCQVFEVNTADAAKGNLKELEAIAAAVIGGVVLTGGFGTILGICVGAFIFGIAIPKIKAPTHIPSMVPKPPVNTTPPITAAAIASSSFRFPFAASAVLTSNTWQVAKTVAQNAENINKETFTLSVGTPFALAALKFPPVE